MMEPNTSRASTWTSFRAGVAVLAAGFCIFASTANASVAAGRSFGRNGGQGQQAPAPIERRSPPVPTPLGPGNASQGPVGQRVRPTGASRGMHIAEWMSEHSTLTLQQQQQALQREPGFENQPQPAQQRMLNRLSQLNAMDPQRRQRLLARNEAMERLSPDQRADVRGAMGQLGNLPMDQRREVARTFRALRVLPPNQRLPAFNSGRFGAPFNDAQRAVLDHLLRVEPMLLPPANVQAPTALPPR